jgi:cytidylate kinase
MLQEKIIIAIDGYSSCGKSTVAKALAKRLSLRYIDSGAMYRAVTLYFIENKIPIPLPEDLDHLAVDYARVLLDIHISFKINAVTGLSEIYLNGINVEKDIRSMLISDNVSHVSAIPVVRKNMVNIQQKLGMSGGLVMDGRDIGTTVFPNADLKIFMVADPDVRAMRRYQELKNAGIDVRYEEVKRNISSRDHEDTSRDESPLRKASDAVLLDNTKLNFEQQVDFVLDEISKMRQQVKSVD